MWRRRGKGPSKSEGQPDAKQITHAPERTMRSEDEEREPVQVASGAEWPLPDARRNIAGRTEGQQERIQTR